MIVYNIHTSVNCPPVYYHKGKVIQMSTFVGTDIYYDRDIDLKIFDNPKKKFIKEGVWTGLEPKCMS